MRDTSHHAMKLNPSGEYDLSGVVVEEFDEEFLEGTTYPVIDGKGVEKCSP